MAVAAATAVAVSACGSSSNKSSSSSSSSASSTSSSSSTAASNGITSKSADQIFTTASTAAKAAKSLHVGGAIKSGASSVSLDLNLVAPNQAAGTVSYGSTSFQLVETGSNFYLKPDLAFLEKTAKKDKAAVALLKGKWFRGSATNSDFTSFEQLTSIKGLFGSLTGSHGTLTKGATSTLGGQPVIAVKSSKGGTLYVATTGTPYPLEVTKTTGSSSGKVTFSDYDKTFTITAPANSISIGELESGG